MKQWIAVLCIIGLLLTLIPMTVSASSLPTKTLTFGQLHGYIRTLGRTAEYASSLYMDNVASGFEFYFYGKGDVTVNASVLCSTDGEIAQYLTVITDGQRSRVRIACDALHTAYDKAIVLASGLAEGYHHIEVYRQTEAQVSLFRADSLTFTGSLMATPPEAPLTIDVIGDSISGGYGCLWNTSLGVADPACNHPYYQDGTQSYAFYAGKALGANVRVTQSSGYGCVAGWNGRDVNLQTMYPLACSFRSGTYLYTFDPLADVVIINLGTNDYGTRDMTGLTNAEFKAGAKNLMQIARQYNPGAAVVWCTGMMGSYYTTEVKAAVQELGGTDAGYYFLTLPTGQGGAVSHPNVAQQTAAGETLLAFLKNTVLPSDYTAATATKAQLQAAVNTAKAVSEPSALLSGAITRAEAELAVGTTDGYRLYARMTELNRILDGDHTALDLMPRQYISQTPTAADGTSYIWPYYDNLPLDGSVTMYKGGDGLYWPQINTALHQVVDIDETPYWVLDFSSDAAFNATISYRRPDGELVAIRASTLAGLGDADFAPQSRQETVLDFGAYIRQQGHADSEGMVSLVSCDMFVVGNTDTHVRLYASRFTADGGDLPTAITGSYPIQDGLLTDVQAGTTAAELLEAMDHSAYLSITDQNGTVVSGTLATGMTLRMTVSGSVVDTATIVVTGDINRSGDLSTTDARLAILCALEGTTLAADQLAAADVNKDADVSTLDARLIMLDALMN